MIRHRTSMTGFRWGLSTLAVVVALVVAPSSHAAPGKVTHHTNPVDYSLSVLAATSAPRTGPLGGAGVIAAGLHPSVQAWVFKGGAANLPGRSQIGTATLVLNSFPVAGGPNLASWASLGTLIVGNRFNCWELINTDRFRPLPREWLALIDDRKPIVQGSTETLVYDRIIVRANYTSQAAFNREGRRDLTYAHLISEPESHRGKVIHVRGTLRRINRFDPSPGVALEGVNDFYEGWIFPDTLGAVPYLVVFTEWPKGLPRSLLGKEKLNVRVKASFAGYFFKLFNYSGSDPKNRDRVAPLLVGHTLYDVEIEDPVSGPSKWGGWILWCLGAGLLSLVAVVAGLTYYFRRSDNSVRQRLRLLNTPEFVLPPPDALPVSPPPTGRRPSMPERPPVFPSRINLPPLGGDRRGESPPGDRPKSDNPERPPDEGAGA